MEPQKGEPIHFCIRVTTKYVPKYMPNTIPAPRNAPNVWKRKNVGNFFQGSLPRRQSAKVTAGFR